MWNLSSYEPTRNPELLDGVTLEKNIVPNRKAQIIKRKRDSVEEFIKEK